MSRFLNTLLACAALLAALVSANTLHAQRQTENLGRGVVAVRTASTEAYIGWRLLGTDPTGIAFNLYRSIGGGAPVLLNVAPLSASTNYRDNTLSSGDFASAISYTVVPVLNGIEQPAQASAPFTLAANAVTGRQYLSLPLATTHPNPASTYPYDVKFAWVGDLDGDGEYDFVLDRLSTNPNASEPQFLEAYKRDGTFLWRMAMGPNSVEQYAYEPGSTAISIGDTDNVTVYDMDGDGRAEVLVRTANGVTVTNAANAQVAAISHANDTDQFVSVFDGLTGAELGRVALPNPWAAHGTLTSKCAIGYFDGTRPSVLFYGYNREDGGAFRRVFSTFDYRNGVLSLRWTWAQTGPGAEGHQIRIADVDNDGRDEICDIGHVIDDDGTQLFYTELTHGDRFHIADLNPNWPGLETYAIQQYNPSLLATAYYSSDTGVMFKKWYSPGLADVGRGIALDMDPNHYGYEMYSTQPGIWDANGNKIFANNLWAPEGLWWDGDLSREFVDGAGSGALSPVVNKFNPANGSVDRIYTIYNDNGGVHQAFGGRPAFWGDILGDWREELVLVANDFSELRIYTTTLSAPNRLYTLMHNAAYRVQATTKGYVQSSYVDYYLGTGMTPPPPPPVATASLFWQGGAGAANTWDTATTAWKQGLDGTAPTAFSNGTSVLFDHTGNNAAPVILSGALAPSAVTVFSAADYTFDGSAGSLTGAMTLTKLGAGTLTLTGSHNFTGATTVWDGALRIDGQLTGSPLLVWGGTWGGPRAAGETGGRISGAGTIAQPVTLAFRSSLTPGNGMNNAGTLSLAGGLTAEAGSTLAFDLSDDPAGTTTPSDRLAITGDLNITGATTIHINLLNTSLTAGTYTLVTYTGALNGAANLAFSGLDGIPYSYSTAGGAITLTVPTTRPVAALAWQGGAGSQWDLITTQSWLRDGTTTDGFVPGDSVTFDSTGSATPSVNITEAVNPFSVTVSSATNYTFTGSGSITGSTGLAKSGAGTLTLDTLNSFTGPVTVNGGLLAFETLADGGSPSPIGASSASASNLVLDGGGLRMTGSDSTSTDRDLTLASGGGTIDVTTSGVLLQLSGVVGGPGALTKTGSGTVILASANTYAGGTVINDGRVTLASAAANRFALGSGPVTIGNGTLAMTNVQNFGTVCAWDVIVPAGANARLEADGRCDLTGSLTGSGNLTFYTPFVRTELMGDWSAFTGKIFAVTDGDGGDMRFRNAAGIPNAELDLGANTYTYWPATLASDLTVPIGALTGASTATLRGSTTAGRTLTWEIGAKNLDTTFPGIINNAAGITAITKVGTGTLTLTGANTYSGATTVSAGILLIEGTSSASPFTVQSGGTLGGTGTITGPVNFQSGSRMLANIAARLNVTGTASFDGTVTIVSTSAISDGSYTLLSATSIADNATFAYDGPLASGQSASFSTAGGNLVVTFANINGRSPGATTWTGAASAFWNDSAVNWKLDINGSPTNFITGDFVTFDDTLAANPTITVASAVAPLSVTFNNVTTLYTLGASGPGSIGGSGTLVKNGAGSAILNGAHSYTGTTTVNAGALLTSGSLASSAVTVSSGASFGGATTLTGDATFATGSRLLAHTDGPLAVNGTLALPATISVNAITNLPDGVYTVLTASSVPAATWSYTGPLYIGQTALVTADATSVTLTLAGTVSTRGPAPVKWSGLTSAVWSTAVLNNWRVIADNTDTPYINGDSVLFDDTLTANPTITLASAVLPASVVADNASTAYRIDSSGGGISGSTTLVKNGTGTLTLAGGNAYTGGTVVNAGILALGDKTSNNIALGSGPITLNGGTLRYFYTNTANLTPTIANAFVVPAGANGRVQFDQRCILTGPLTGSGTLTIWIPFVRTDLRGNWSAFSGELNVTADLVATGDAYLNEGGDFRISNTAGYPNARVHIGAKVWTTYVTPPPAGANIAFGALSGHADATLAGTTTAGRTATWTIGALNLDTTYAGRIINGTGPSAVVKVGTGTLTLSGNNTYTGITAVNAGRLILAGTNTNTGATTINNGGTLELSGSLANASTVEVKAGGTLHLTGTLTTGTLTIRSGGKLTGGGTINATVINEGLISADAANFVINGNLTNAASGTIRLTRGAGLSHSGTFTNNGLLDLISAGVTNLVIAPGTNTLDPTILRGTFAWTPGQPAVLTMTAWIGHTYQLQRTTDLAGGVWESVGAIIEGDGTVKDFIDPAPPANDRLFYRVVVDQ